MTWPTSEKRPSTKQDHLARTHYEVDGWTVAQCATFLGLSKTQARVRLLRAGTVMRKQGHRPGTPFHRAEKQRRAA